MKIIVNIDKTKAILAKKEIWGHQTIEVKVADIPENLLSTLTKQTGSHNGFDLTCYDSDFYIVEANLENVINILKMLKDIDDKKLKKIVEQVKTWMKLPFDDLFPSGSGSNASVKNPWDEYIESNKLIEKIIYCVENYSGHEYSIIVDAIPDLPNFLKKLEKHMLRVITEEKKRCEITSEEWKLEFKKREEESRLKKQQEKKEFVKILTTVVEELGSDIQKKKWEDGYMNISEVKGLLHGKHAQTLIKEGFSVLDSKNYKSSTDKDTLTDEQFIVWKALEKFIPSLGSVFIPSRSSVDSRITFSICRKEVDEDSNYENGEDELRVAVKFTIEDRGMNLEYLVAL